MQVIHEWELQVLLLLTITSLLLGIIMKKIWLFDFKRLIKHNRFIRVCWVFKLWLFFNYAFRFYRQGFIKQSERLLLWARWIILNIKSGYYLSCHHCWCSYHGSSLFIANSYSQYRFRRLSNVLFVATTIWRLLHWN